MFRVVIPAILAVALTACGGGGSGSGAATASTTVVDSNVPLLGAVFPNQRSSMVLAKLKDTQTQYLVMGQYRFLGSGKTEPGPIKVYQLNNDGTMSDATVEILGGATVASTNAPLIADFNHDGIDDIFLAGFSDTDELMPSIAFISRPGRSHIRADLPDPVYSQSAVAIDANNDGHLDVMNSSGQVWFNDGQGNFTFRNHTSASVPGMWINGSGVCAGDFNNTGRAQVVLIDQSVDGRAGPISDSVIFELGGDGQPAAQHYLPVPILDRGSVVEKSHDVACLTGDLNNDGKLDILIFSRPLAAPGANWSNEGAVQVLINRGNWNFDDVTDQLLVGYNTSVLVSYTAKLLDLNGDGKLDLWAGYFDYDTGKANQAFLNNGLGTLTNVSRTLINSFNASGGMLPVKFGDKWAFVFAKMNANDSNLYLTKPLYTFN